MNLKKLRGPIGSFDLFYGMQRRFQGKLFNLQEKMQMEILQSLRKMALVTSIEI